MLLFVLAGRYLNVYMIEDLNQANFLCRSQGFNERRVSLVVPAYNEAAAIAHVLRDFEHEVDEIVVMDNNSPDGTGDIARRRARPSTRGRSRLWRRAPPGYGRHQLHPVLVEADATFRARDLGKLLEYVKDADMVIGTRTTRQLIEQGDGRACCAGATSSSGSSSSCSRWGLEPRFTDVGYTYRVIWCYVYCMGVPDALTTRRFSPEMMIEILRVEGTRHRYPRQLSPPARRASKHSGTLGTASGRASRWSA